MLAIDEVANASPARSWPPLGKLMLALALLIASLASSSLVAPLIVLIIGMALLSYSTAFRFPRIITLAILDGLAVVAVGALIIAVVTPGAPMYSLPLGPWAIVLTDAGVDRAVLVLLRSLAGISVMLFFATSTPIPHLAHAMRSLRLPREVSELVILVYRYTFLVLEQSERMFIAAQCRLGTRGLKNSLRTFSRIAVGMFTHSIDTAERAQTALYCRDFRGDFPSYREPAPLNAIWILVPVSSFLTLFLADRVLLSGVVL
jgi:cobalt/nickel transport system permease protein